MFDQKITAPEFPDNLVWLNSPPLKMSSLKGKVVLVDFWTYSCINCQRTLPFIKKWWEVYKKHGLVIIGVHSPEFDFEKDPKNVQKALEKYQVNWPTVMDPDMKVWSLYANHYWPAKYLVDHNGKIIFSHFGEGNYIETEIVIQSALKEAGFKFPSSVVSHIDREAGALWKTQTPELYLGYLRGSILKLVKGQDLKPDQVYTTGGFKQETEYLQHNRETKDLDDLVTLSFRAKEVYLVMESEDQKPVKVYITLDGVGLDKVNAGKDVKFDSGGRSFVEVNFSTLYNIVSGKNFGDHILRLSTTSDKLRMFAFTFGS